MKTVDGTAFSENQNRETEIRIRSCAAHIAESAAPRQKCCFPTWTLSFWRKLVMREASMCASTRRDTLNCETATATASSTILQSTVARLTGIGLWDAEYTQ